MGKDKYVKFGGMKFEQNASNKEVNKFVNKLPDKKKQSIHQVVESLDEQGLIDLKNQVTTIDDEMIEWQETDKGKE